MIKKKKYDYFQTFQLMSEYACNAAIELMNEFKNYCPDEIDIHLQKMHRLEKDADARRCNIMQALAKDFRPPLEREDIVALSNALDDVVDMVEDISIGLYIYHVREIPEIAMAYSKVVLMCCDAVKEIMKEFEKLQYNDNIMDAIKRVNHLEEEGDTLFAKTTRELFSDEEANAVSVIRWKSMYGRLEKACDACEKVGYLVESIILKQS